MPQEIDQAILDSPNIKVLDINKPPMRTIPHLEFPKMVFAHPKDKAKEHKIKIVHSKEEETAALKLGFRLKPHLPVVEQEEIDPEEYETKA